MGQVYPRTSLILASGRRGRRITVCPRLTRAIHKALHLRDWPRAADPRLYLCLLHSFCWMMVEGHWVRSDILLSQFCMNLSERWSVEGSGNSTAVCRSPHQQESAWEVLLRLAAFFLLVPWWRSVPWHLCCPCSSTAAWPASSSPCASVSRNFSTF